MGRKKLDNPRKHTAFRFTDVELDAMRDAANYGGQTLSAWVRDACLAHIKRRKPR